MGRPKRVREIPVEEESQEGQDDFLSPEQSIAAANGENNPPTHGTSKAEAVRQALAKGLDDLDDIAAFLKQQHNIEMPRPQISAYKAQQRARERKASGEDHQPRARSAPQQPMGIPAGFSADVKEIRDLMERMGGIDMFKETVGQLSGLLGKYGPGGLCEVADAIS